ncbi:MAG TPA: response regulator transcription factor [Thermoanaerobaculia bacterium]|nr:response regulator transcription factor [Thermoanaerobaculia bacterium]
MTVAPLVLVVDDDPGIREALARELRAAGYTTAVAGDGAAAFEAFRAAAPDLVLTDLAMPVTDGFSLISALRGVSSTPIVVLSVRGGEPDKVRALDLGADDFVTKPFSVAELLARVRAQLRRNAAAAAPAVLRFDALTLDFDRRRVLQGEREVKLTPTELGLLELLARNAGRPVTLDQMIARVWKGAPGTTNDTVRVHVSSLRRKLEPDPARPHYIVTEPWVGYRFIAEPL